MDEFYIIPAILTVGWGSMAIAMGIYVRIAAKRERQRRARRLKNRARMYMLRPRAWERVELLPGEWEAGRRRAGLDVPERKPPLRKVTGVFSGEAAQEILK